MKEARPWTRAYDPGVPATIEFENLTLPELLRRSAEEYGESDAIRFLNRTLTYRELAHDVARFAAALSDLGVESGTRVAIALPNIPQTVIAFYATLTLGGVAVMTNPLYVEPEIEHQWNDAGCDVAITTDFLYERRIEGIRDRLSVREYVIASIPEYLRFPLSLIAPIKLRRADPPAIATVEPGPGIHFFKKLVEASPPEPPPRKLWPRDLAALQYTGGTTGVSKGAMLSHGNLSANVEQIVHWLPDCEPGREVFLSALPFFHVFGLTVAMNFPVAIGGTMVLMPNPRDIPRVVNSLTKQRVSIFPVVPALVRSINEHRGIERVNLSTIKVCVSGSAPMPEATLRRFEELTSGKIIEGFGLTEASPVTHVNPVHGNRKVNTIGLPLPNTDCRIVSPDDDVTPLPPDRTGELVIRGPQVMQGYWNLPEETANSLRDGWLYTGDLAEFDEDGYFRIVGRKKEMIVCGGYNVYPDEVDRVLSSHPAVLECATIGVPDEKRGETVKSFVVLQKGQSATIEEIQEFCRERLAAYKIPRQIEFRESLPKNTVLKILRRELQREELAKAPTA